VASPDKKAFLLRLDPEVWNELESRGAPGQARGYRPNE
jgi:hypothetical protein